MYKYTRMHAHHTTPHYITPHYITLHHTTPHHTTPHHTTPHHTTLHHVPTLAWTLCARYRPPSLSCGKLTVLTTYGYRELPWTIDGHCKKLKSGIGMVWIRIEIEIREDLRNRRGKNNLK